MLKNAKNILRYKKDLLGFIRRYKVLTQAEITKFNQLLISLSKDKLLKKAEQDIQTKLLDSFIGLLFTDGVFYQIVKRDQIENEDEKRQDAIRKRSTPVGFIPIPGGKVIK